MLSGKGIWTAFTSIKLVKVRQVYSTIIYLHFFCTISFSGSLQRSNLSFSFSKLPIILPEEAHCYTVQGIKKHFEKHIILWKVQHFTHLLWYLCNCAQYAFFSFFKYWCCWWIASGWRSPEHSEELLQPNNADRVTESHIPTKKEIL